MIPDHRTDHDAKKTWIQTVTSCPNSITTRIAALQQIWHISERRFTALSSNFTAKYVSVNHNRRSCDYKSHGAFAANHWCQLTFRGTGSRLPRVSYCYVSRAKIVSISNGAISWTDLRPICGPIIPTPGGTCEEVLLDNRVYFSSPK